VYRFNKYKLLVFDFDGTLVDSLDGIVKSFNYVLDSFKYPKIKREDIEKNIGFPLINISEHILKVINKELPDNIDIDKYIAMYREYYVKEGYKFSKLYNGIFDFLQKLKKQDKQIAILTNRSIDTTNQILNWLNVRYFFDVVTSGETINKRKPDPEGLFIIMEKTNIAASETIMIGDTIIDIDTAVNGNIDSCFVRYGYGGFIDEVEKKATFILDNFANIS